MDGYPRRLGDGLRAFIAAPNALGAWVADLDGEIVGHVVLNASSAAEVMSLASVATRQPEDRLGVVARLLVAPTARRSGIARSLLGVATQAAYGLGRQPILDVVTDETPAIRLYESSGWRRVGAVTVRFADDDPLEEFVYVAPGPPRASPV